jgi:hypothetical protein
LLIRCCSFDCSDFLAYQFSCFADRLLAREDPVLRAADTGAVAGILEYRSLVLKMVRKMPTLIHALLTRSPAVT